MVFSAAGKLLRRSLALYRQLENLYAINPKLRIKGWFIKIAVKPYWFGVRGLEFWVKTRRRSLEPVFTPNPLLKTPDR